MGTATLVKELSHRGANSIAQIHRQVVYELQPPMRTEEGVTRYVMVSAAIVAFTGPETYIFSSDADGTVTSWDELEGSYRGGLDHAEALRGAGYKIA